MLHNIVTLGLKQFRLLPEGFYQGWTATHPPERLAGGPAELGKILRAQIGQFMLLAISPDVFHRVEFRSVSRQILQKDLSTLRRHKLAHQTAAMGGQAIPNNRQLGADVSLKMFEKLDHLRGLDAAGEESEVEIPNGDACHGREALPVEGILQHRSLASRSPGSHPVRPLAQAALVHENYGPVLLERFFFISPQRTRFHCRIAGSSRCVARPTGRWQLQPRERKIRQTCPG